MDAKELIAAGFKAKTYKGQEGVFYVVERPIKEFDFCSKTYTTGDFIQDWMDVVIEICPEGIIQFCVMNVDFFEGFPLDSQDGQDLLADALNTLKREQAAIQSTTKELA